MWQEVICWVKIAKTKQKKALNLLAKIMQHLPATIKCPHFMLTASTTENLDVFRVVFVNAFRKGILHLD